MYQIFTTIKEPSATTMTEAATYIITHPLEATSYENLEYMVTPDPLTKHPLPVPPKAKIQETENSFKKKLNEKIIKLNLHVENKHFREVNKIKCFG